MNNETTPAISESQTLSDEQINEFIAVMSQYYQDNAVLSPKEGLVFSQLFQALLAADLDRLRNMIKAYADAQEDGLLVLAAFTKAIGAFTIDFGNTYSWRNGSLYLGTLSKEGVSERFSKFTGKETHSLEFFNDGREPTGCKSCRDDRLRAASDAESGPVPAQESLDHLARVVRQAMEKMIVYNDPNDYDRLFAISVFTLANLSRERQFIKDRRVFAAVVAAEKEIRNKWSYFFWRWQNRVKLERFAL